MYGGSGHQGLGPAAGLPARSPGGPRPPPAAAGRPAAPVRPSAAAPRLGGPTSRPPGCRCCTGCKTACRTRPLAGSWLAGAVRLPRHARRRAGQIAALARHQPACAPHRQSLSPARRPLGRRLRLVQPVALVRPALRQPERLVRRVQELADVGVELLESGLHPAELPARGQRSPPQRSPQPPHRLAEPLPLLGSGHEVRYLDSS